MGVLATVLILLLSLLILAQAGFWMVALWRMEQQAGQLTERLEGILNQRRAAVEWATESLDGAENLMSRMPAIHAQSLLLGRWLS